MFVRTWLQCTSVCKGCKPFLEPERTCSVSWSCNSSWMARKLCVHSWFLTMPIFGQISKKWGTASETTTPIFKINYLFKCILNPLKMKNQIKFWLILQSSNFLLRLFNLHTCKTTKTRAVFISTLMLSTLHGSLSSTNKMHSTCCNTQGLPTLKISTSPQENYVGNNMWLNAPLLLFAANLVYAIPLTINIIFLWYITINGCSRTFILIYCSKWPSFWGALFFESCKSEITSPTSRLFAPCSLTSGSTTMIMSSILSLLLDLPSKTEAKCKTWDSESHLLNVGPGVNKFNFLKL